MKAADMKFEDIKKGDEFAFTKKITRDDVMDFARIMGNFNPLHVDDEYGKRSKFGKPIVFGMQAASLFSTLLGMYCPGKKALCLSQTLNFRLPLFFEDTVTVKGTVIAINEAIKILTVKTEILKDDNVCISGEAKVTVIEQK